MNSLTLELSVLVLRGRHVRRRHFVADKLHPWSDVASVKQRVEDLMASRPDEIELMMGARILADTEILSECGIQSGMALRVLAYFPERESESLQEELLVEPDVAWAVPSESSCSSPPSTQSGAQGEAWLENLRFGTELSTDPCPEEKLPPPPALTCPSRWRSLALRCEGRSFRKQDAVGTVKSFDLRVNMKIILGLHVHVRTSLAYVTDDTKVSDIEETLRQWLGSDPDEMVLMVGTVTLDGHSELRSYNLGESPILQVIIWYEHARNVRHATNSISPIVSSAVFVPAATT